MGDNPDSHGDGYHSTKPLNQWPTGSSAHIGAQWRQQDDARRQEESARQSQSSTYSGFSGASAGSGGGGGAVSGEGVLGLVAIAVVAWLWANYSNEVVVGIAALIAVLGLKTSDWTQGAASLRRYGPWIAILGAAGAIYLLQSKQAFPEHYFSSFLPPYWPFWLCGAMVLSFYPISIMRTIREHPVRYGVIAVCLGVASVYGYNWYLGHLVRGNLGRQQYHSMSGGELAVFPNDSEPPSDTTRAQAAMFEVIGNGPEVEVLDQRSDAGGIDRWYRIQVFAVPKESSDSKGILVSGWVQRNNLDDVLDWR